MGVNLRMDTKKHMLERDWIMCATILDALVNIIGGTLYDHFETWRIFTLTIEKIFIQSPKIVTKLATGTIWTCNSSCTH